MRLSLNTNLIQTVISFNSITTAKLGLNKNFTIEDIIKYGDRASCLGHA